MKGQKADGFETALEELGRHFIQTYRKSLFASRGSILVEHSFLHSYVEMTDG